MRVTTIALTVLLAGCAARPPGIRYPALREGTRYLCCTTRFDSDDVANDGGYRHEPGVTIEAGTPLRVVAEDDRLLVLEPNDTPRRFTLKYRFGRRVMPADEWFALQLPDHDPRDGGAPAAIQQAISAGRLVVGMTRAEAITARGYPPLHHTPDRAADRWVYFDNRDDVEVVQFQNGRIAAITPGKEEDLPDVDPDAH